MMRLATCIGCGCDDLHACYDARRGQPCHWLRVDYTVCLGVCSCCRDWLVAWDAGDRTLHAPAQRQTKECHEDGTHAGHR